MSASKEQGRGGGAVWKAPHSASLGEELRKAAAEAPDKVFIRMVQGEWTYRQVDSETDLVAAGLARLKVQRGQNVTLMLPNCIEFAIAWFALSKLGAVTAPVNTSFRGAALANAINLVKSRLVLVHASLLPQLREVLQELGSIENIVVVDEVGTPPEEGGRPVIAYVELRKHGLLETASLSPPVRFSELSLLLYTSGTTGRSKAAMISHRFVLGQAGVVIQGLGLRSDDVLYCPYPMFHLDAAVMTIAPALLLRGVAAIGEKFSVSRYWDEVRALGATVFDFMGATLTMLWKQAPKPNDRDNPARLGWGVPLPAWAPQFEERFGCRLVELYGLTEAGTMIYTPLDKPRRLGSCGKPAGPFEVQLVDEDGTAVPAGGAGELVIRATQPSLLMDGYFGMPEETLAAFRNLWFHTGDVLRADEDGYLYFVGRRKDVVRRRGENISAAEVEMGVEGHPDVLECAVIGVPSDMTEEEVMVCVVARESAGLTPQALADFCATRMARFMVPRYIRFLQSLPKTPTDKVEKFRLLQEGITADTWDREKK
ncbi:AMP-binding protein [Polaromonas jejuensis]|uniref:AMP-binding protein n=1 Tax=Polaromonas jejuensis TaxID=457502 RepID=A0ABW0QES5_9BURK|nr:AMP-binding protein [Polaromonas jejuensis]